VTEHLEFREGRRLSAADLNDEASAREADLRRHLDLAHATHGGRPGLVGNQVSTPSGSTSVSITPTGPATAARIAIRGDTDALHVGAPGGHHVSGAVTGEGAEVRVEGALRLLSQARPAAGPAPWSIQALDVHGDDGQLLARELRIELSAPSGSSPHDSRVAVGTLHNGSFSPVMIVDAGGNVTVSGDLEVAGSVSQGVITPDPEDPRFVELLTDVVARRIVGTAATTTSPAFLLQAQVVAAGSTPQATALAITLTPTRMLARWGAALEIRRGGTSRFRLLRIGGNATAGQAISIPTTASWSPDLSAASPASLVAAVAAFDTQGRLTARSASVPVP
jgi:hypothetical protein